MWYHLLDYAGTGPVHGVKAIDLNGVSRTCAYDLNRNMTTSPDFTNATNPLNRAITYDADNMPTRIVHANGATVDFVYDGVAKRTKKLVQSGKTMLYLGDHFEVENGVNIKYIFGGNLRLAQIKGSLTSSSTSYFHKDHLGSTAAVTDETGQKKESTTYEPFGSTRTQEGTAVSAYKFTDQELDNETNLYNYDARLYDPVLGMFVTPDSIMPRMYDPQSLNRYTYCRNNPLIYVDPTGHVDVVGPDEHGGQITTHDGVNLTDSHGKSVNERGMNIKEGVCVCTRETKKVGLIGLIATVAKQFGKQLNHAYVYDNKSKTSIGMAGSSGSHPAVSENGPGVDNCNKVPGSEDNEDEIMKEVKKAKEEAEDDIWNGWMPGKNDCYTAIEKGLKNAGVENPEFPDPRISDTEMTFDWSNDLGLSPPGW